jgi:hypothetical protein
MNWRARQASFAQCASVATDSEPFAASAAGVSRARQDSNLRRPA